MDPACRQQRPWPDASFAHAIEGEIQIDYVDPRFAKQAKGAALRALGNQAMYRLDRHAAGFGDAGLLILRGRDTDVGIETTGRRR